MSTSIDERIVEMRFDNSKFETNASKTLSTLDKLKQALKFDKANEGLENVNKAAANVKLDTIGTACETVSTKFSALQIAAYTALSNITNDAVNAGKRIMNALTLQGAKDGFAEYEEKMGSVQTIMNGTGESLETVMGYLEELNEYADRTIYSFSDMTSSIGKFTNAGVDLKTAVAAIQGISNAVALSGGAADKASIAMYNFAQALSIGYVGLTDWKSIELSGMATLDFKRQVMDTAVELGTLKKTADGTYKTIESGTEVTAEGMRETLKQQWFTSEVLTTVLAKYADQSTELGKKANEAATKVKTFSMMIDTLKESIGSGWAITWETIIGDFNQASSFFTDVTNTLSEVISAQADARNKFLDAALNKGDGLKDVNDWTKLATSIRNAGGDVGKFKNIIIDTARTHGIEIDKMIEEAGDFNSTLAEGWLSPDILDESVSKAQSLGELSPEFEGLAHAVSLVNKPFRDLLDEITEVSGRTHIINSLKNVFDGLRSIITPIKDAFREVFPPKTADDLRETLSTFEDFTKKLKLSSETAARVKNTFQGFFTVIKKGIDIVKAVVQALSPLKDIFSIIFENVLIGIEGLGKFFNTIDDGEDSVSLFEKILNGVHDVLQSFADNLQTYIDVAVNALSNLKDMISQSWDTGALSIVATIIEKIKDILSGFTTGISDGLQKFFNVLGKGAEEGSGFSKVIGILEAFAKGLKAVAEVLFRFLEPLVRKIKDFFTELRIADAIAMVIKTGSMGAVVAILGRMADNIADMVDVFHNLKENLISNNPLKVFGDIINGIGDLMGSLEDKFRSDVIVNFAISVGILAAAIFVVSSIDAEAARRSVAIITLLVGEIAGIFTLLSKIDFGISKTEGFIGAIKGFVNNLKQAAMLSKVATTIMKLAASVLILAISMKIIAGIDSERLLSSFMVISILLWELVGVSEVIRKGEKTFVSGAGAMIAMALAVTILAGALSIIAGIDSDALLNAFLVLTAILFELTIFLKVLDGGEGVKGGATLIGLALAITILAAAMKIFESMSWEGIGKGLTAITVLLIELGIAMKVLESNIGAAASLIIASIAITILAASMKIMETIDAEGICRVLILLGGALLELSVGLMLMESTLPGAAALLIASVALIALAGALRMMDNIDGEGICRVLILLGGVLLELAVGMMLMEAALPGAAALLVAAAAIAVLTPALIGLSKIETKKVYAAIGEICVALLGFGAVSAVLGIVSPLIAAFGAALLLVSGAVVGMGAGITASATGLEILAVALQELSEISTEACQHIVENIGIILEGVITFVPRVAKAVGDGIIAIIDTITEGMPKIRKLFEELMLTAIQVYEENIPRIVQAFATMVEKIIQTAKEYVPRVVDTFYQMITDILNVMSERIPEIINAGVEVIIAFIQGIQEATNRLVDAAMETMIAFINGLAESIRKNTPLLVDAVNNLMDAIFEAIQLVLNNKKSDMKGGGKGIMDSFKSGISERVSIITNSIRTMINDCIKAIKEKITGFKDSAKYLIEGFINGIKEKTGSAVEVVKSFGSSCLSKLENVFKIASPSKATKQIGKYFDEGFEIGVENEKPSVIRTVKKLGENALSSMTDIVETMISDVSSQTKDFYNLFEEIGSNAIDILADTFGDGDKTLSNAGFDLGSAALEKVYDTLSEDIDINPTITPVLDLTNIREGASEINKTMGNWQDLSIGSSRDLANKASTGFTSMTSLKNIENQSDINLLKSAINALSGNQVGITQNNTFNISGDDPRGIADEVSRALQRQVERRGAVWA